MRSASGSAIRAEQALARRGQCGTALRAVSTRITPGSQLLHAAERRAMWHGTPCREHLDYALLQAASRRGAACHSASIHEVRDFIASHVGTRGEGEEPRPRA